VRALIQDRRLVESEPRRVIELQTTLTGEQAMVLLATVVDPLHQSSDWSTATPNGG
jgi:hypothetical protein